MRLTRLELFGFKSFPDRTTFHFGPGISCVVGPNGSGKSNVVDALKWCVGEQSARSLRGAEMSDVIFAGSADRKPVGFAEVIITLETDESQPFLGDYASLREVAVGRRLHRTGLSEYTINQTKVRRKDVIELLLDSGVGNDLYSFIEQGQVDKMISASAEERRSLIDEAAGISRYKARRDEAKDRLQDTASQLDRAADVVDEMARQLRTLEAAVLKTAEFRRLHALVRVGEIRLSLAKYLALSLDRGQIEEEVAKLRKEEGETRASAASLETDIERLKSESEALESTLASLREQSSDLDGSAREAKASAGLHERRHTEILAEKKRTEAEAKRHRTAASAAEREGAEAIGEHEARQQEIARTEVRISEAAAEIARAEAERAAARAALDGVDRTLQAAVRERASADAALVAAERTLGEQRLRGAALETDLAEKRHEAVERKHRIERARAAAEEAERAVSEASARTDAEDAALAAAREREMAARAAVAAAEESRDRAIAAREIVVRERTASLERGMRWLRALEQSASEELSQIERKTSSELKQLEDRHRAELNAVRQEADAARRKDLAAQNDAALARRAELDRRLSAARASVTSRKAAIAEGEKRHIQLVRALAGLEAEHEAVQRQLVSTGGADKLLRKVLPEAKALIERAPPEARAEWVRRLGDRARWAVVEDEAMLAEIAKARPPEASVSLLYWPAGAPNPIERIEPSEDLRAALRSQAWRSGGEVAGDGFRIESGGFVTLGPPGELERAAKRERELAEKVLAARVALEESERARAEDTGALTEAERAATDLAAERDEIVRADALAVERAHAAAAERGIAAEKAAREAFEAALRAKTEERERLIGALRAANKQRIDAAKAVLARAEAEREPEAGTSGQDEGVKSARLALKAASDAAEAARKRREASVDARVAKERARNTALTAVTNLEAERERAERAMAEIEAEIRTLSAAGAESAAASAQLSAKLGETAAREEEARRMSEEARGRSGSAERRERAARESMSRLEIERAALIERATAERARAESSKKRSAEALAAAERAEAHAASLDAQSEAAQQAQREALEAASSAAQSRASLADRIDDTLSELEQRTSALEAAQSSQRSARARIDQLGAKIERVSQQLGTSSQDLELLRSRMDDRYQVSLPGILGRLQSQGEVVLPVDEDVKQGITLAGQVIPPVPAAVIRPQDLEDERAIRTIVKEVEASRAALAAIGEVNLAAPAEHRELLARHDDLAAQRLDLEQSVEGIRTAIAKLNRLCRERFRETFDQVNGYFQAVYPSLVGGGSARLSLTSEEDLLETGVDIFVQPPGKRLQNLQLLSGGEKAMTAIALLISLFRVKPSPFCVLDEVDAPLDEANGARFNEMLKEMSVRSQFLVITHNRKTMECADTLYGITMARPGVSRLVSVDLEAW